MHGLVAQLNRATEFYSDGSGFESLRGHQFINYEGIEMEDKDSDAEKACIHLYLSLHVSEMKGQTEQVKFAWSVGQELYLGKQNAR